jgi:hypothetical protein
MFIPSTLFVHGNAAATANNIATHETLFRFGIVSDLLCGTICIFLTLALYRLFKGVDQNLAGGFIAGRHRLLQRAERLQVALPAPLFGRLAPPGRGAYGRAPAPAPR